jgi:hypothetical protein
MSETPRINLDVLAAKVAELGAICERLATENAELRGRLSQLSVSSALSAEQATGATREPRAIGDGAISRRKLVGRTVGLVAGSAAASAVLLDLTAGSAAASNGSNVVAGAQTTAEGRTSVLFDGNSGYPGVVLLGNDSTYDGSSASFPAGVGGWAGAGATVGKGGVANGVYGFTDNGAGNGVVGVNSGATAGSGAGVLAVAHSAKGFGVDASNTAGTAVSGSSDSTAANATAILGTLTSTTPGGFSAAVKGANNGTTGFGIGVWGSQAGSGWGMYASSNGGIGVNADGGSGTGVNGNGATGVSASGSTIGVNASGPTGVSARGGRVGVAATGPTGVQAAGSTTGVSATGPIAVLAAATGAAGIGVRATTTSTNSAVSAINSGGGPGVHGSSKRGRGGRFDGGAAQVQLSPGSRTTHPVSGSQGDLYADKLGRLWFCKKGGNHATWHQIA